MLEKFKHHKNLNYFALYSIAFLVYAMHICGLGPYIPYISARTGLIQTQYSYLFTCRSLSMFIGGFIVKFLQKHSVRNHNILIGSSIVMGIFSFLFTLTVDRFWLGFWLFSASLTYASVQIVINVCTLMVNPPQQMQFWMLTTHAVSGIGGLLGPFVIYLFQQHSFAIYGLLTVSSIPFLMALKSPEENGFLPEQHLSPKLKKRVISQLLMIILGALLFFYMGLQTVYGGWISSYAVLTNVTDIQGATVFPSIFWIVMTLCRFLFAFAPGTSSQKLKRLVQGTIIFGVFSLILIKLGYIKFACYISGLMFGVSLSSMYPLVFTIPIQNGLNIEESQTSNMVMAGVMAEGILAMIVGLLMQWFTLNMLFYSLTIIACIMWLLRLYALNLIDNQTKAIKSNEANVELLDKESTPINQF